MRSMTFEDWKAAGFSVNKGEHSASRNKQNKPLFTRAQVHNIEDNFTFDGHKINTGFEDREADNEIRPDFSEEDY